MRALVFALAATLVAMLATTDARPVAAEPFARVRTPDPATSTMFPTHHMDGRLWARHADGAWAKGTGRWRDAGIAMAEYARVHGGVGGDGCARLRSIRDHGWLGWPRGACCQDACRGRCLERCA